MIILDNSVFAAALFADEKPPEATALYHIILEGEEHAAVPPLFLQEAANAVITAWRRKRITQSLRDAYLLELYEFPVTILPTLSIEICTKYALEYDLSIYDATYLTLAIQQNVALATFDKALARAAKKLKIPLLF